MTKAVMALEAEKAELARMMLDLDDMELVEKAKAVLKRITAPKEGLFFANLASLEHLRRSVKQRENGEVVELTSKLQKELLGL